MFSACHKSVFGDTSHLSGGDRMDKSRSESRTGTLFYQSLNIQYIITSKIVVIVIKSINFFIMIFFLLLLLLVLLLSLISQLNIYLFIYLFVSSLQIDTYHIFIFIIYYYYL